MFFNATIFIIVLHSNLRIKVAACPPRLLIVPSDLVLICGLIIGALFSYSTMVTFVLAIMLASLHIVGSVVAFIAGTRGSKEVTPVEQGNSEQV